LKNASPFPLSIRAELVEAPLFSSGAALKGERPFDKLRANGCGGMKDDVRLLDLDPRFRCPTRPEMCSGFPMMTRDHASSSRPFATAARKITPPGGMFETEPLKERHLPKKSQIQKFAVSGDFLAPGNGAAGVAE
jgi:hypothetical protein